LHEASAIAQGPSVVQDIFQRRNNGNLYLIGHSGLPHTPPEGGPQNVYQPGLIFSTRESPLYKPIHVTGVFVRSIPECSFMQIWTRLAWD
jgi:hypothetical protein